MAAAADIRDCYFATGGRPHAAGRPLAVLVHGAGMDHTAWALQSRWLAFHGWNVVAVDLPGHGRSPGVPLGSVDAMAQALLELIANLSAGAPAVLIGHSMGSLVALHAAALAPTAVSRLVLIGTAAAMPVHPDLLAAAKANDHAAIDMVNLWGHGFDAGLGGSRAPGVWMTGAGERILERAAPGVLHNDLAACNAYRDGLADAAKVSAPTLLICGERDQMTPLKSAKALGAAIAGSSLVAIPRAGHMLMSERPYEVVDAMAGFLRG
ncbi:MAG: alpha/beta hydrolase [Proteobacteria bacterium]|nr:alpha/beta hydrolase [Pseudomonadota bacterium]